ncbi:MAG: hypothetical protein DI570_18915 [Phenylobacterium zucineum]|nr:MAG: hypothetical protein DI570_18915 [Phenylobacterium zucineum]
MSGFAVSQGSPLSSRPDDLAVGVEKPEPFFDALGAAFGPNFTDASRSAAGRHDEDFRASLWARHRDVERRTGQKLPLSESLSGEATRQRDPVKRALDALIPVDAINARILGRPGVLTDDAYEAKLAELKAADARLGDVQTRDQILGALQAEWNARRAAAGEAADAGPGGQVGAFLGQAAGTMTDVPQLGLAIATGGAGAGRSIGMRMLAQAGVGGLASGLDAPDKMDAARRLGGPEYGAAEGFGDVVAGAAGGAAFEGVFSLGRAALRGLRPTAPAERRALDMVQQGLRDDDVLGDLAGADHELAAEALERGAAMPRLEPTRDIADLFAGDGSMNLKGRPISAVTFDPGQLATDPTRFQYKAGGDSEGVTSRLRGVEAWDPLAAGRVIVWEDAQGVRFVADGHQRFGLVRRLNDDRGFEHGLDGFLFREADGWRAGEVRVLAALKNIREGSGTALDAAKVFREAPEALKDRSLPLTGEFMAQARGLADLAEPAFRAVVNKVIDERYAAEIGRNAASRPDLHENMVGLLKQADPANVDEARALVVEALQDDWIKAEGSQEDLFGYDPSVSAMIGRAKVAAAVKRTLAKDTRLFNQLVKNADAIEAGGNALARDANQARLALDRAALEVAAKLALRHGPIGEAMAGAAARVAKGEAAGLAARPVIGALRKALEAGERLDELRGVALDPKAPGAAAEALALKFDEPGGEGARGQAEAAPEDLAAETGDVRLAMSAEIDRVLEAAGAAGHAPQKALLGDASPWLVDAARAAGLEIDGFAHVMDGSAVRHVTKNHGDVGKEAKRGQIAVTEEDFRALPDILAEPDAVMFGAKGKRGEAQIFYAKAQPDGSTLVVEEVRNGRRELALQSMRRVPGTIDDARLGKLADPNAQDDAGTLKIVRPPQGASAVAEAAPPGLFDDLFAGTGDVDKAQAALIRCVPGGSGE